MLFLHSSCWWCLTWNLIYLKEARLAGFFLPGSRVTFWKERPNPFIFRGILSGWQKVFPREKSAISFVTKSDRFSQRNHEIRQKWRKPSKNGQFVSAEVVKFACRGIFFSFLSEDQQTRPGYTVDIVCILVKIEATRACFASWVTAPLFESTKFWLA